MGFEPWKVTRCCHWSVSHTLELILVWHFGWHVSLFSWHVRDESEYYPMRVEVTKESLRDHINKVLNKEVSTRAMTRMRPELTLVKTDQVPCSFGACCALRPAARDHQSCSQQSRGVHQPAWQGSAVVFHSLWWTRCGPWQLTSCECSLMDFRLSLLPSRWQGCSKMGQEVR